jgi:hypothetical protein
VAAALTVGLVSDTHIPRRLARLPETALTALRGVDLILHAGDVDALSALEPMRAVAPVYAVRGNVHVHEFSDGGARLPAVVEMELAGRRVVLTHGHRPGVWGFGVKVISLAARSLGWLDNGDFNCEIVRRLVACYPDADVIVFGHTHRAHVQWVGRTLLVNPGAVCPTRGERPTVARLQLGDGPSEVEIAPLDQAASGSRGHLDKEARLT